MSETLVAILQRLDARIEDAAIAIAKDANPQLNGQLIISVFATWAADVREALPSNATALQQAEVLAGVLFGDGKLRGDKDYYYDPNNIYIDRVLRRQRGIPLSLSVIAIAVGRRAGIQVDGIGFPGHFLIRVGGPAGVYQDPYGDGRILDDEAFSELATRHLGPQTSLNASYFQPVDTKTMTIRMLANLKRSHRKVGDYARAMLACDRLVDLTGAPEHRRDRGLLAHALGSYPTAREDLEAYLAARPNANDAQSVNAALDEARASAPNAALH